MHKNDFTEINSVDSDGFVFIIIIMDVLIKWGFIDIVFINGGLKHLHLHRWIDRENAYSILM